MVGGAGKAGAPKARRFIHAELKGNLMTRRNKAGKIEYSIGGNKKTIASTAAKARQLHFQQMKPTQRYATAKIKGKISPKAARKGALKDASEFGIIKELEGRKKPPKGGKKAPVSPWKTLSEKAEKQSKQKKRSIF